MSWRRPRAFALRLHVSVASPEGDLTQALGATPNMQLIVKKINQLASGGSYIVVYEADLELLDTLHSTVEVFGIDPPESDKRLVETARLAILQGAECVLGPMGLGASIRIHRLVIQPNDFQPKRFVAFTAAEIERLLSPQRSLGSGA